MKYFDNITEPFSIDNREYYKGKRETVLETIKPICEAFGIADYDYCIELNKWGSPIKERLIVEGQAIGCMGNSIGSTVRELIGYLWVKSGACDRIYNFRTQTLNQVKQYWIKGEEK